mmetsp:Transcript_10578/g.35118  ORF Transcript_10578/g.35118 Transcript_10578/m.35118 type:complete len:261 (+) Transcript_10578:2009-2791(+)
MMEPTSAEAASASSASGWLARSGSSIPPPPLHGLPPGCALWRETNSWTDPGCGWRARSSCVLEASHASAEERLASAAPKPACLPGASAAAAFCSTRSRSFSGTAYHRSVASRHAESGGGGSWPWWASMSCCWMPVDQKDPGRPEPPASRHTNFGFSASRTHHRRGTQHIACGSGGSSLRVATMPRARKAAPGGMARQIQMRFSSDAHASRYRSGGGSSCSMTACRCSDADRPIVMDVSVTSSTIGETRAPRPGGSGPPQA